jgi:hypothetical protein
MFRAWASYGHILLVLVVLCLALSFVGPGGCNLVEQQLGPGVSLSSTKGFVTNEVTAPLLIRVIPWLLLGAIVCYGLAGVEWWFGWLRRKRLRR